MPKIELNRHDKYADDPEETLKADAATHERLEAGLIHFPRQIQ